MSTRQLPSPSYDDLYELIHTIEDDADNSAVGSLSVQELSNTLRSIRDKARMALGMLDRMSPDEREALYPTADAQ